MIPVNNRGLEDDFAHGTGMDAALDLMAFTSESASSSKKDRISSREYQALYKAFHERMLPVVKDENPGLRHTQYDEKIMKLWKRSPENPMS